MNIDDMSTDTIKNFLEKRINEENGTKIFNGHCYSFKVIRKGNIYFYDELNGEGECTQIACINETILALRDAVELAIKRRKL